MKKAILYFIAVLMLASIPAMDLMAKRASHGDWYFREEWGGTQYSAYSLGNGKVHYKILIYATGSSRNFWAYTDENDITQGSRCWTQLEGSADQPVFLIYEADNKGHNRPIGDDCDVATGQMMWDLLSAMEATEHHFTDLCEHSEPGFVILNDNNELIFTPDPAGNCRYQVLPEGKKETIVSAFKDVMHEITKYHR